MRSTDKVAIVFIASCNCGNTKIVAVSDHKTVRVFDAETGEELLTLKGHADWVRSASYSPDGRRIVTASEDGSARIWDAETGEELVRLA